MRKNRFRLSENYLFCILLLLVFAVGFYSFIKKPNKSSNIENRSLSQFQHMTWTAFLDGSFQDNFENALSDQFPKSEVIRANYGSLIKNMPDFGIGNLVCQDHYLGVSENFTVFDCEDYLIRKPGAPSNGQLSILNSNIKKFNRVNDLIETYYYIINTPETYDFENAERITDYAEILSEKMTGNYKIASLKYDGYKQYKQYFYKNDHHWNHNGSYQGFLDIAKMLGIKNPAKPVGTFTNHESYFGGSSAKTVLKFDGWDEFIVYKFDIPEHTTKVERIERAYSHVDDFIEHNYEYTDLYAFYANVYGGSRGEVYFDFHQPEKPNLLMVVDSFSNPIKELIAQYFNKTYAVDLRHYQKNIGEPFAFEKYINNNKIDKVLFIASSRHFLLEGATTRGLEL